MLIYRWRNFKLIEGHPGRYYRHYRPPFEGNQTIKVPRPRKLPRNDEQRNENTTRLFDISGKMNENYRLHVQKNIEICWISVDPNETTDISSLEPGILDFLLKKLTRYKEQEVAAVRGKRVRKANPKWWPHRAWSPGWCWEKSKISQPCSNSNCVHSCQITTWMLKSSFSKYSSK